MGKHKMTRRELAKYIDHTALKATVTKEDIRNLCKEAKKYGFASVCVNPCRVKLAANLLAGSDVKVCTVIGFPLGANIVAVKALEAEEVLERGAEELDMVINVGALKSGHFNYLKIEVSAVKEKAQKYGVVLKVILETCYLTDEEIARACEICEEAGADFVKTSTGFGTAGATVEHVRLMKKSCSLKVKASGGIKTLEQAMAMIGAGADRLGCSAGVAIIEEMKE